MGEAGEIERVVEKEVIKEVVVQGLPEDALDEVQRRKREAIDQQHREYKIVEIKIRTSGTKLPFSARLS